MRTTFAALALATLALGGCSGSGREDGVDAYVALEAEDLALATATMQKALEGEVDGKGMSWRNSGTGHAGAFTPLRSYVAANGYFCRLYREDLRVGDGEQSFQHEACRNEKGMWVWL